MINNMSLVSTSEDLVNEIIATDNVDEIKDLTALFNLNQTKKNMVRNIKLNNLLDNISDEMIERFENKPSGFDNELLLDYLKTVQSVVDKTSKFDTTVSELPTIVQQNNTVIVNNDDTLSRESKQRVADAVMKLMNSNKVLDMEENDGTT